MTVNSPCRLKYLRTLITIVLGVGIAGYLTLSSGDQPLIWIYPGVAKDNGHDSKLSIPSKLRLLSVNNHSEVQTLKNLSSFNESTDDTTGKCYKYFIFTARVRSATGREGTVFTGVGLLTFVGGGVPRPRSGWRGGTLSQVWVEGGYPVPGLGGGVPHPRSGGYRGYPIPGLGGYPIPGLGGTPFQVWGYPIPGLEGVCHPWSGQGGYPGYPPVQTWDGVPPPPRPGLDGGVPPRTGWGTPPPPTQLDRAA